ncbi:hypothetical protein Hanom_Chr02g00096021 [Helianthus anomalus]
MEHNFHEGFVCWVYSCMTTEAMIVYKVGNESRDIHLYDPMWIVNCSVKDIECLFVNKIGYKAEDKDQALQFQKVVTICFQREFLKAEKERKEREEKGRIVRATCVQRLAEEEKRAAKENEKLRKALLKNRSKGKNFSSLCERRF